MAVEKVSVLEDVGSVEELKQDRGQEEGIKASGAPAGARQLQAVSGGGKLAQFHPAPTSKGLPSRKALWEVVEKEISRQSGVENELVLQFLLASRFWGSGLAVNDNTTPN